MGFIIALIVVALVRATAFRGTDTVPFIIDLILLAFLTAVFSGC